MSENAKVDEKEIGGSVGHSPTEKMQKYLSEIPRDWQKSDLGRISRRRFMSLALGAVAGGILANRLGTQLPETQELKKNKVVDLNIFQKMTEGKIGKAECGPSVVKMLREFSGIGQEKHQMSEGVTEVNLAMEFGSKDSPFTVGFLVERNRVVVAIEGDELHEEIFGSRVPKGNIELTRDEKRRQTDIGEYAIYSSKQDLRKVFDYLDGKFKGDKPYIYAQIGVRNFEVDSKEESFGLLSKALTKHGKEILNQSDSSLYWDTQKSFYIDPSGRHRMDEGGFSRDERYVLNLWKKGFRTPLPAVMLEKRESGKYGEQQFSDLQIGTMVGDVNRSALDIVDRSDPLFEGKDVTRLFCEKLSLDVNRAQEFPLPRRVVTDRPL